MKRCCYIFLFVTLRFYAQELPQSDTLRLNNGLKVYLLNYGEDTTLSFKLVINGGKKDETTCQIGYSGVILGLLNESLKEKQISILKKENNIDCSIEEGQTVIKGNFSIRDLNPQMEVLSTSLARLAFTKEKIDPVVQSLVDEYSSESMKSSSLATIYRDLSLYGDKNPLGRTYCQYQIQKALPEQLREFYNRFYQPYTASLIICGNFNNQQLRKTVTKHFIKWRSTYKEEHTALDLSATRIQSREIMFVNKWVTDNCELKWIHSAPSFTSANLTSYILTTELFDQFRLKKMRELEDSGKTKPTGHFNYFSEWNSTVSNNRLSRSISNMDSILKLFYDFKPTEEELNEAKHRLTTTFKNTISPAEILAFYDPLLYNFNFRLAYPNQLASIQVRDLQQMIHSYFKPEQYKLIIVGKELAVNTQLKEIKNLISYRTLDFETCDEACREVIVIKYHCESCYRRGQSNVWRFDPNDKEAIKNAKARAKAATK